MPANFKKTTIITACFLTGVSLFYLFTYNSGYGYDALEYLVIGRSLLNGYHLYSFVTSKSWGVYWLVSAFLHLGNVSNHWGVSLLVTLIFSCAVIATFFVIRRVYNERVAIASSVLTAICAVFMEMNFLETEALVYIFGVLGFYWIARALRKGGFKDFFTGGFFIGVGFAFKSVAGFYFAAVALAIPIAGYFKNREGLTGIAKKECWLSLGLFAALIPPALYFALSGRLTDYFVWSYYYPLLKYPTGLIWFYKLHTKLLWFFVLLFTAFIFSFRGALRKKIYANPINQLVVMMGLFSFLALLKTQASHYVFPGAAFLSIFIAVVWDEEMNCRAVLQNKKIITAISFVLLTAFAGSICLYDYPALKRLVSIYDYSYDYRLKTALQKRIPEGKKAIFLRDDALLYWLSERYPNIPLVFLYSHTAYALDKNPNVFLHALDNPDVVLVEFNPQTIWEENRVFFAEGRNKEIMLEFYGILNKRFAISDLDFPPYIFWVRKTPDR